MFNGKALFLMAAIIFATFLGPALIAASDLDDGISEYTEDPIASEEKMGSKDTNINFIVVDAIAKARMAEKDAGEKQDEIDKNGGGSNDDGNKTISNINDGKSENNENSVVVESGGKVDRIYNIVIEK